MAHLESLVIYDPHERSREALVFGFERDGYKVYATGDDEDALGMAQTRVAQLVVASIPIPEEDDDEDEVQADALSLVGLLREEPGTRELPIVVLGERGAREPALRAGADEFVAKPAFIRDVLTLSTLAVALRQDGDETGVAGMLQDYELYFLTRALSVAVRSGVLEVERGDRSGEVQFVKGEVVAARCGRMTGVAAFQHLLLWGEASIHLRMSSPTGERKMMTPIDELLATGAQFAREFEALSQRIGGSQSVYKLEPRRAAEARAQIPAEVMALLKHYDGRRPFIDVVEDSPFKPLDTIKIAHRLSQLGVLVQVSNASAPSPLTAQLAVRDWLLGSQTEETPKATVTEAGRRAAEAYADAAADRAAYTPPAHELLDDTDKVRTLAQVEVAAPAMPIEDPPTAPRPSDEERHGPQARNKRRKRGDTTKKNKIASDAAKLPKVELKPSQPPPKVPPVVDIDATIPFSKFELLDLPLPDPRPAPAAAKHAPAAAKPAPAPVKQPKHPAARPAPQPKAAPTAAPAAAKQAPARPASDGPKQKELHFTDVEEEFFAQESELAKVAPAEIFDDLEPIQQTAPKRKSWFNFGSSKNDKFTQQVRKAPPPKKR